MVKIYQIKRIFIFFIIFSLVSCRVQKGTTVNEEVKDRKFYKQYSEKLGIQLSGTENRRLIKSIAEWFGVPYKYGGCTKEGTDCSCLIKALFNDVYFIEIPRNSADIYAKAIKIKQQELMEGDLVFFSIGSDKVTHIGLYIGNNKFVHASTSKGVMINDLTETYYTKYFIGAGRIGKHG